MSASKFTRQTPSPLESLPTDDIPPAQHGAVLAYWPSQPKPQYRCPSGNLLHNPHRPVQSSLPAANAFCSSLPARSPGEVLPQSPGGGSTSATACKLPQPQPYGGSGYSGAYGSPASPQNPSDLIPRMLPPSGPQVAAQYAHLHYRAGDPLVTEFMPDVTEELPRPGTGLAGAVKVSHMKDVMYNASLGDGCASGLISGPETLPSAPAPVDNVFTSAALSVVHQPMQGADARPSGPVKAWWSDPAPRTLGGPTQVHSQYAHLHYRAGDPLVDEQAGVAEEHPSLSTGLVRPVKPSKLNMSVYNAALEEHVNGTQGALGPAPQALPQTLPLRDFHHALSAPAGVLYSMDQAAAGATCAATSMDVDLPGACGLGELREATAHAVGMGADMAGFSPCLLSEMPWAASEAQALGNAGAGEATLSGAISFDTLPAKVPSPVTVQVASRSRNQNRGKCGRRAGKGEAAEITRGAVGIFYPKLYLAGGDCIECNGEMIGRGRFERLAGTATAKWHVSIKVLPCGWTLGRWLRNHGLPVLQGKPRKRRQSPDDADGEVDEDQDEEVCCPVTDSKAKARAPAAAQKTARVRIEPLVPGTSPEAVAGAAEAADGVQDVAAAESEDKAEAPEASEDDLFDFLDEEGLLHELIAESKRDLEAGAAPVLSGAAAATAPPAGTLSGGKASGTGGVGGGVCRRCAACGTPSNLEEGSAAAAAQRDIHLASAGAEAALGAGIGWDSDGDDLMAALEAFEPTAHEYPVADATFCGTTADGGPAAFASSNRATRAPAVMAPSRSPDGGAGSSGMHAASSGSADQRVAAVAAVGDKKPQQRAGGALAQAGITVHPHAFRRGGDRSGLMDAGSVRPPSALARLHISGPALAPQDPSADASTDSWVSAPASGAQPSRHSFDMQQHPSAGVAPQWGAQYIQAGPGRALPVGHVSQQQQQQQQRPYETRASAEEYAPRLGPHSDPALRCSSMHVGAYGQRQEPWTYSSSALPRVPREAQLLRSHSLGTWCRPQPPQDTSPLRAWQRGPLPSPSRYAVAAARPTAAFDMAVSRMAPAELAAARLGYAGGYHRTPQPHMLTPRLSQRYGVPRAQSHAVWEGAGLPGPGAPVTGEAANWHTDNATGDF